MVEKFLKISFLLHQEVFMSFIKKNARLSYSNEFIDPNKEENHSSVNLILKDIYSSLQYLVFKSIIKI